MGFSLLGCRFGNQIIYQRYIVTTMVCISIILLYGSRYALSATLAFLISHEDINTTGSEICIRPKSPAKTRAIFGEYLDWDPGEQYYVYSCFYIGYILFHIPSGILCDVYGAKHFLSGGVLASGLITSLFPVILTKAPWYYAAILQGLLGSMQGICMPALISLMSHFITSNQMTFLVSYGYSGGCIGTMLCIVISSYFINKLKKWESLFYFWTALSIIWYICSTYLIFSTPSSHPFISAKEKKILAKEMSCTLPRRIPWKAILLDTGVWALVVAQMGHNFILFTVDTHLPSFFDRVLAIDITSDPYLIFVPYIGEWLSTLCFGLLGDYLIRMKYLPVVYIRTLYAAIGIVVPHIFIILATYMNCNKFLIGCCFTLAMTSKGTIFAALKANIIDITRYYSGIVQAIHNGLPAVTGLASPHLIKFMCKRYTVQEWRKVLFLSLAICIFTTTIYFVWSKGDERASWDRILLPKNKKIKHNSKPNFETSLYPENNK